MSVTIPRLDTPADPPARGRPGPEAIRPATGAVEPDRDLSGLVYRVAEPPLTGADAEALAAVRRALPRILRPLPPGATERERTSALVGAISEFLRLHRPALDARAAERIAYYPLRDALGYGPIDRLLLDEEIEDISCDGVGVPVFVHHARWEALRTNVVFEDETELQGFVVRLAQRCGRSVSVARPLLDGTTPEGHRIQATYGRTVSARGPTFTIRRFRSRPWTPLDLLRAGTLDPPMAAYLWMAAEEGDSLLVCGGPGAGKTRTLNALALFVPAGARIVSIEDTRELNLPHPNWIPATTRTAHAVLDDPAGRAGEIDMHDLVTSAMRQRPTHLFVGEVRGREASAMFQAMNTGHVTWSTFHADTVRAMVTRLESPPLEVARALFGALRLVVIESLLRTPGGPRRRITEIVEIRGIDPETEELALSPVFSWDPENDSFAFVGRASLFERIAERRGVAGDRVRAEWTRRSESLRARADGPSISAEEFWRWASAVGAGPP